jgi:hypothetical protein
MSLKPKRRERALEVRTFDGEDGAAYVVFRTAGGAFHTFREVEAKEAARECGGPSTGTTRQRWNKIWSAR